MWQVSHELRTPLTSIKGFTELLLDGDADEINDQQTEFLGIATHATRGSHCQTTGRWTYAAAPILNILVLQVAHAPSVAAGRSSW